jgi:hypothetical protein
MREEMESEQRLIRSILLAASKTLPFNSIRRDDSRSVYTQTIRTMKRNSDGCADLCGQETEVNTSDKRPVHLHSHCDSRDDSRCIVMDMKCNYVE